MRCYVLWAAVGLLLGLGVALVANPREAWAATRTVPTSPGCATIQGCVDASAAGDTVRVLPGRYSENVTVDEDLTIEGSDCERRGVVILDAQPGGVAGVGFDVTADGVTIRCLTVRNGTTGIQAGSEDPDTGEPIDTVNRLGLNTVIVEGSDVDNINVAGDRFRIQRSRLFSSDSNAVDVEGNGARVLEVLARGHNDSCVRIRGDDAEVEGNRLDRCEDSSGIRLEDSADPRVSGNRVRFSDGGIEVFGAAAPQVTGNTVIGPGSEGFDIDCIDRCGEGLVEDNTATGGSDDADGFEISSSAAGLQILNNTASDNISAGFDLLVEGAIVRGNTAERNGSESELESGFDIEGDGNLIEDNRSIRNKRDGFRLLPTFGEGDEGSNRNVFRGNTAVANSKDGFDIDTADTDGDGQDDVAGTGNRLIRNVATDNRAEGIENNGLLTDVLFNQSSGNRIDCANDGTIDQNEGNECADGSDFEVPPEIE